MLAEYLASHHPTAHVRNRVRLGPTETTIPDETLSEAEQRLLGAAWRRWADAVVIEPDRLLVIETKLIPRPGDASQVLTYLKLVAVTPELQEFAGRPTRGRLVWGCDDPWSRQVALEAGLEVVVFKPSCWGQFVAVKRAREGRPARTLPLFVP